jgi:hypothetical protein
MLFTTSTHGLHPNIIEKAKTVDLNKVGHLSGLKSPFLSDKQDAAIKKTLIASMIQKYIDKKTYPESAFTIRELTPEFDFKDGEDNTIVSNIWTQPAPTMVYRGKYPNYDEKSSAWNGFDKLYKDNPEKASYSVYRTSDKTYMKYKCICIFGIQIPKHPDLLHIEQILIWRTGTKLLDRFFISGYEGHVVMLQSPIIMGDLEDDTRFEIRYKFKTNSQHYGGMWRDCIKFLGYVVEFMGVNPLDIGQVD